MAAAIRLATADDATAIARIYEPAVTLAPISFEATPPDAAQMAARIRDTLMSMPWIVYEADQGILGYAYASRHRERPAYRGASRCPPTFGVTRAGPALVGPCTCPFLPCWPSRDFAMHTLL
jgi:hypothetical protein